MQIPGAIRGYAAGDGYVNKSGTTWSTVRSSTSGTSQSSSATTSTIGSYYPSGTYYIARFFLPFNTSTVLARQTITGGRIILTTSGAVSYPRNICAFRTIYATSQLANQL